MRTHTYTYVGRERESEYVRSYMIHESRMYTGRLDIAHSSSVTTIITVNLLTIKKKLSLILLECADVEID